MYIINLQNTDDTYERTDKVNSSDCFLTPVPREASLKLQFHLRPLRPGTRLVGPPATAGATRNTKRPRQGRTREVSLRLTRPARRLIPTPRSGKLWLSSRLLLRSSSSSISMIFSELVKVTKDECYHDLTYLAYRSNSSVRPSVLRSEWLNQLCYTFFVF